MFDPFGKPFRDVAASDLATLRDVSEGWYVEYKRDASAAAIGKSLCAFANHYGGWLFLGIDGGADNRAASFGGLERSRLQDFEMRIRQSAASHCSPPPYFELRFIDGPDATTGLRADRVVAAVRIPPSDDVPHVHSSGRIYRRIGSGSEPKEETDRGLLDQLLLRRRRVEARIRRLTRTSYHLHEQDTAVVEAYFVPRVQGAVGVKPLEFDEFREISLRDSALRYDNFFAIPNGYAARCTQRSQPNWWTTTLRYFKDGAAHATFPLDSWSGVRRDHPDLQHLAHFSSFAAAHALGDRRVVDASLALTAFYELAATYWRLLDAVGLADAPLYLKTRASGIRRCVPFVDTEAYVQHTHAAGVPFVEVDKLVWPRGRGFDGMELLEPFTHIAGPLMEGDYEVLRAFQTASRVVTVLLEGLGLPKSFVENSRDELFTMATRRHERIRRP